MKDATLWNDRRILEWYTKAHPAFEGRSPQEMVELGEGQEVLDFIERIE